LFDKKRNSKLLEVISKKFDILIIAYVINWIPEQSEDIYVVLVNNSIIAKIEISRVAKDEEPLIEVFDINQYERNLSKVN